MSTAIVVDGTEIDFWYGSPIAYLEEFLPALALAAGVSRVADLSYDEPLAVLWEEGDRIAWREVPALRDRLAGIVAQVDPDWREAAIKALKACQLAARQHRSLYTEG